jgi:hypothetical protein
MNYKTLLLLPAALALGAPANAYVGFRLNLAVPLPLYYPATGYYYPAPVYAQTVSYDAAPGTRSDQVTPAPGPGYVWRSAGSGLRATGKYPRRRAPSGLPAIGPRAARAGSGLTVHGPSAPPPPRSRRRRPGLPGPQSTPRRRLPSRRPPRLPPRSPPLPPRLRGPRWPMERSLNTTHPPPSPSMCPLPPIRIMSGSADSGAGTGAGYGMPATMAPVPSAEPHGFPADGCAVPAAGPGTAAAGAKAAPFGPRAPAVIIRLV